MRPVFPVALRVLPVLVLLPAVAGAQAPAADAGTRPAPIADSRLVIDVPADASTLLTTAQAGSTQPPPPERRRRRPSMVGYINDAGIQSQVRLRFDVGQGIDSPDRAEFFYPKCGCYRDLPSTDPAFDPEAPGPRPGAATDLDFRQLYLQGEYAPTSRFSIYGELPVRWLEPKAFVPGGGSFGNQSGLSDLRLGVKLAAVATDAQIVTVQIQGNLPTGDGSKGLGVEHFSFEPALLYNGTVNDRVHFEGQFGAVLPTDGSEGIANASEKFAGNVLYYGFGPSVEIYSTPALRVAPVVEFVGWHVLSGFQTSTASEADGINILNLKVGGRLVFRDRSSLYIGYGKALTDDEWYDDILRVEYRVGF